METNQYISYINDYITNNTPVTFIYREDKYNQILEKIETLNIKISNYNKDIICASYALLYTSLSYHQLASDKQDVNQPYYILLGDYISSYIVEILNQNKLYKVLKIFSLDTKKIMLNILNDQNDNSELLDNIIKSIIE